MNSTSVMLQSIEGPIPVTNTDIIDKQSPNHVQIQPTVTTLPDTNSSISTNTNTTSTSTFNISVPTPDVAGSNGVPIKNDDKLSQATNYVRSTIKQNIIDSNIDAIDSINVTKWIYGIFNSKPISTLTITCDSSLYATIVNKFSTTTNNNNDFSYNNSTYHGPVSITGIVSPVHTDISDEDINNYVRQILPADLRNCITLKTIYKHDTDYQLSSRGFTITDVNVLDYLLNIPSFNNHSSSIYWKFNIYKLKHFFCFKCGRDGHRASTCTANVDDSPPPCCPHCRTLSPDHIPKLCPNIKNSATKSELVTVISNGAVDVEAMNLVMRKYKKTYVSQSSPPIVPRTNISSPPPISKKSYTSSCTGVESPPPKSYSSAATSTSNLSNLSNSTINSIISTVTENFSKILKEHFAIVQKQMEVFQHSINIIFSRMAISQPLPFQFSSNPLSPALATAIAPTPKPSTPFTFPTTSTSPCTSSSSSPSKHTINITNDEEIKESETIDADNTENWSIVPTRKRTKPKSSSSPPPSKTTPINKRPKRTSKKSNINSFTISPSPFTIGSSGDKLTNASN